MHDATEGGHKKSSKTANAATRVILLVESSYAQLPWAQQCQKTIGSIIDYLERSAGQGCLITYAAAHQDVPVTSSGWVRDMPALRELAEGICFTGSGQAAVSVVLGAGCMMGSRPLVHPAMPCGCPAAVCAMLTLRPLVLQSPATGMWHSPGRGPSRGHLPEPYPCTQQPPTTSTR
jgi:hypothetical protein